MHLQMNSKQAKAFSYRLQQARPAFRHLVKLAAKNTEVRLAKANDPMGGNYTETEISGDGLSFLIVLQAGNFAAGNRLGRHLQMHELAHVIANSLASVKIYNQFFAAWSKSPLWQECFPQGPEALEPCVSADEIFADQLAFWATGDQTVRSSYQLPALASRKTMDKLAKRSGLSR